LVENAQGALTLQQAAGSFNCWVEMAGAVAHEVFLLPDVLPAAERER